MSPPCRRDHHRPEPGHDLPGRPAAGEGRHRRGHQRRGTGRGRDPRPSLRRRRPCGRERRARAGDRPRHRRRICHEPSPSKWTCENPAPPLTPEELYGLIPDDVRAPYDVREVIARLVDGSPSSTSSRRCTVRPWSAASPASGAAGRDPRQQRRAVQRERQSRAPTSSNWPASARSRCCSCRTSRASWSAASTRPAASPRTAPSWSRPSPRQRCPSSPS
jgi:hypothetical protein